MDDQVFEVSPRPENGTHFLYLREETWGCTGEQVVRRAVFAAHTVIVAERRREVCNWIPDWPQKYRNQRIGVWS